MKASMRYAAAALAACLGFTSIPAQSQSNDAGQRPATKAQPLARLMAPDAAAMAARIDLPAPPAEAIATIKSANARSRLKRLEIGIGRDLPETAASTSAALRWSAAPGGMAAHWQVHSGEARALRVALRIERAVAGLEVRFAGSDSPDVVYGPFSIAELATAGHWSPVLEGDVATVELFLPAGASPQELAVSVDGLSHLFVSPADPQAESVAKAAGACQVNLICRSATDAVLAQAGRSVAKMTYITVNGGSSMCTGTLLNPGDGSFSPYFYSAAHCISTPSSARTITTHWFYDSNSCSANTVSTAYVQRTGGAVLLHASEASDVLFVRLNSAPPAEAVFAGWDATTVARGSRITAIHHPDGDLKKVSLGAIAGFDSSPLASGNFIRVHWDSVATGVTEGGSSGSAIFSEAGSALRVRGGLLGGASSCAAGPDELFDVYSRLDLAFPFIAQHLSPAAAPALGPNAAANPDFEGGAASWTQSSTQIITNDASLARSGSWYAWLGGADNVNETLTQPITIPAGPARLQFWYRIATTENTSTARFDTLSVSIVNPGNGTLLQTLGSLSNLDATADWVQSPVYDASAFVGQAVRLELRASTDGSLVTSFRIDDVTLNGTLVVASGNQTALWYNPAESGWGINVSHQGDIAFATLFTYTTAGTPMWLVMPAGTRQGGSSAFMGALYRTTGPAFNANPFPPIGPSNITEIGSMTVDFNGGSPTLGYTVNDTYVSKAIEKQVYGAAAANCQGTAGSRAGATNYQDLWWNPAESGWGINLTHQGNILFATLFTYAANGQGLWLVLPSGARQADGSFSGELFRTNGPAFNAQPWPGIGFAAVGTMRLRFQDGENGTLEYSVDGVNVTKAITRQVFGSPAPLCSG